MPIEGTAIDAFLLERFGQDTVISLATVYEGRPFVRYVNAVYRNGSFYILTHARSAKMEHIRKDPSIAIAGMWFTGQGLGKNRGWVGLESNKELAALLKNAFASWLDNGHMDLCDPNTIILEARLTQGVLLRLNRRYEF